MFGTGARLNLPGGAPTRFSLTICAPQVSVNQRLFAAFVQDEWKLNPKVSCLGLCYEAQTAPNNFFSIAPGFGIAVAPDKKQHRVLHALAGIFYERINESLTLETERLDGIKQRQIIIHAPAYSFLLPAARSTKQFRLSEFSMLI